MQELNKRFCVAPWTSVVLKTTGNLGPCCAYPTHNKIKDISIKDYYNSDFNRELKQKMLNGEEISGCLDCYRADELYGSSLRTKTNELAQGSMEDYEILEFPLELELQISNICNIKCLTCRPEDSSSFLTENKVLKISDHSNRDYQLSDEKLDQIFNDVNKNKINMLDLRGGESMIVPNIKQRLIDLTSVNNVELRIQTNGTIWDDEWFGIFEKFREVNIMISIDAYGDDNHYVRFPAEWEKIENTVNKMKSVPNLRLSGHCTVSNLNLPILPQLLDWIIREDIEFGFTGLAYPDYFEMINLPMEIINNAKQELDKYRNKFNHNYTNSQIDSILLRLETIEQQLDNTKWDTFCRVIDIRDQHRNNSIFDIQPELRKYWKHAQAE